MFRNTAFRASLLIGVSLTIALATSGESFARDGRERQWSVSVRGGATSGAGGGNAQFGALISYPGLGGLSYGLGVGYEQAYDLNIIPVFVDLRYSAESKRLLGNTPGLFFEAGYAAVFGEVLDFQDPSLEVLRTRLRAVQLPTIDGKGYYLNFGVEMTRRLSAGLTYVFELGSKFQSIPSSSIFYENGLPLKNQTIAGRVLGGSEIAAPLFRDRDTLSSFSLTMGLRF